MQVHTQTTANQPSRAKAGPCRLACIALRAQHHLAVSDRHQLLNNLQRNDKNISNNQQLSGEQHEVQQQ